MAKNNQLINSHDKISLDLNEQADEIYKIIYKIITSSSRSHEYGFILNEIISNPKISYDKILMFAEDLISKNANLDVADKDGNTPLHHASKKEWYDIVKLLIDNGANINAVNKNGETVLHYISETEQLKIAKFLLNNKPNINIKDKDSMTPLHRACEGGNVKMIKLFLLSRSINNIKINNILTYACKIFNENFDEDNNQNIKNIIKMLIKYGAKVNIGSNKLNPLHHISMSGCLELAELLINNGADVNILGPSSMTPLHYTSQLERPEMVEFLVQHGAKINVITEYDETPLYLAIKQERKKIVNILVLRGADVNAKDKDGKTPLEHAIEFENKEICSIIINAENILAKTLFKASIVSNNIDDEKFREYIRSGIFNRVIQPATSIDNNLPLAQIPSSRSNQSLSTTSLVSNFNINNISSQNLSANINDSDRSNKRPRI